MSEYNINPFGSEATIPAGYPIANDLETDDAQQALSAAQGVRLKEMIDDVGENLPSLVGGNHVSATRTLTLTTSGTSKQAQYPLYQGSVIHFKLTLGEAVTGKTYLIAKVDSTTTGQKTLLTLDAGATSVEADVEIDKKYNFLTVSNGSTSLASATVTVEATHKVLSTGMDNIANPIQTVYSSSYHTWRSSIIRIPVKKGNVLWFCGYGTASASIVAFRTTYTVAGTKSWGNSSGYTADVNEGFITFDEDGYVWMQSLEANFTPSFILYAADRLKEEIVVAASNTPEGIKGQADYFCTGSNDEELLNLLVDAGIKLGRTIKLLRGDYYLDAPTKQYSASNDTFLLVDTSPLASGDPSGGCIIHGEDAFNRPTLHLGDTAYENLSSSTQYRFIGVYNSTQYGGYVEFNNFKIAYPSNQKKVCAIEMLNFGGWARVHSVGCTAYTNGYNGQNISISNPPAVAVDGCIGIRFIGKGPNGAYGSEITDCGISGFYEGICINTEWTVCTHVYSIFCVYGWVFGKYTSSTIHAHCHPIVLICCGAERDVNLPLFHTSGLQDVELIAFSIERKAANTPGGVLGNYATEQTQGSFRGRVDFTCGQSSNSVTERFWEYGHGHGMITRNMAHAQAGTSTVRNGYSPNYMQRYWDTTLGKEIICVDESGNSGKGTWKDAMGNTV